MQHNYIRHVILIVYEETHISYRRLENKVPVLLVQWVPGFLPSGLKWSHRLPATRMHDLHTLKHIESYL